MEHPPVSLWIFQASLTDLSEYQNEYSLGSAGRRTPRRPPSYFYPSHTPTTKNAMVSSRKYSTSFQTYFSQRS